MGCGAGVLSVVLGPSWNPPGVSKYFLTQHSPARESSGVSTVMIRDMAPDLSPMGLACSWIWCWCVCPDSPWNPPDVFPL
jgi:hypothetical protein